MNDNNSVERLREHFGITDAEMNTLMESQGIYSPGGSLTDEQEKAIWDAWLSLDDEGKDMQAESENGNENIDDVLDSMIDYDNVITAHETAQTKIQPSVTTAPSKPRRKIRNHKIAVFPITKIPDEKLNRTSRPEEGDIVINDKGGKYKLTSLTGEGGEGSIYETNIEGYCVKIYNDEHCTRRRFEKIKQMTASRLGRNGIGICLPIEILYNSENEFAGYLMPKARGHNLQFLLNSQPVFESRFPDWKKKDMVNLSLNILRKIRYLHNHDVIMGDINPNNILVESPNEVYFVDTDSYQFMEFPCPVGTVYYTAPELQGKRFGNLMRTQGNENFAVAVLLFTLMMQGKQPYARQDGGSPSENIRNMMFPYGVAGRNAENQPAGLWRYIWSHLSHKLKMAFWDTFHAKGRFNSESTRLCVDDWIRIFSNYYHGLSDEFMLQIDPMSNEIFPTREKISRNIKYVTCSSCRNTFPESKCHNGMCRNCWQAYQNHRKETYEFRTCRDCGRLFIITNGEQEHYASKNMDLPKRCPECRESRRSVSSLNFKPESWGSL